MVRVRRWGHRNFGVVDSRGMDGRHEYGMQPVRDVIRSTDTDIGDFISQLPEHLRGNARGSFYGRSLPCDELCDVLSRELHVPVTTLFTREVVNRITKRRDG